MCCLNGDKRPRLVNSTGPLALPSPARVLFDASMLKDPCTARFVVHGRSISTVDVLGVLDASASLGFEAVLCGLVGDRRVVIDLTAADRIDDHGWRSIDWAVQRIERHGGDVLVRRGTLRRQPALSRGR